jgi:hypothetical protein
MNDNPHVDPGFSYQDMSRPLDEPSRYDDFGLKSPAEVQSAPGAPGLSMGPTVEMVDRLRELWARVFQSQDQGMEM